MVTLSELHRRLSQNDVRYALHFAGHARLTRRPQLLAEMIAEAQDIARDVKGLRAGSDRDAISESAKRQVKLYTDEKAAIEGLQAQMGPLAREASVLGARANVLFHRYARHFAGQGRSSRDGTLLLDTIQELTAILQQMQAIQADQAIDGLKADIEVVQGRLAQFRAEVDAIAAAQTEVSQSEQAGAMAGLANNLFAQYRVHFAGLPRVTRRPELLVRLLEALESVHERMVALETQGLREQHNSENIGVVENRLGLWAEELVAIRAERKTTNFNTMVRDLETAVNAELEGYAQHFAGQSRRTRELQRLTDIIDRLDEIEKQMTRLEEVQESEENSLHLSVVRDALSMYQNEWDEIAKVQGKA